jgi:hypothetical protein
MAVGTLVAQVAKVVASKGMREAIKKFGKEVVKKVYKDPGMKRAKDIAKGAKIGERYRKTKLPLERGARNTRAQDYKSRSDKAAKTRGRTKQAKLNKIERGEIPDRMSTLGRRGYNFKDGGMVRGSGAAIRGTKFKGVF